MKFDKIRSAYQCEMTILTPVHIGNGEKYVNNFDFLHEEGMLKIFNHNRLFTLVERLGHNKILSFANAVEENDIKAWLKRNKINVKSATLYSMPCRGRSPRDISIQIRDGMGRPLMPGSSLKGAFRTAIMAQLSEEDNKQVVAQNISKIKVMHSIKPPSADHQISEKLLGKDAKMNLMRMLTVADFHYGHNDVNLQQVLVSRLTSPQNMGVKFSVWVEKINDSAIAVSQISFDDYLSKQAAGKPEFGFRARLSLDWLLKAITKKTKKTIATEIGFLSGKSGKHISQLHDFYNNLNAKNEELADNEAIIQLAWGSGWNGMTGQLLEKEELTYDLRKKLQLAPKYIDFPFPKSRRIAVTNDLAVPMGWVLLKFTDKDVLRKAEEIRLRDKLIRKHKKDEGRLYPWRAFIRKIQKISDWGIFKQQILLNEAVKEWQARQDVAAVVKEAAIKVRKQHPKKWDEERDAQVADWLQPAGIKWEIFEILSTSGTESHQYNTALLDQINNLSDWSQYKQEKIKINTLDKQCAEMLKKKFSDWGCKKSEEEEQRKIFKQLVKRLSKLK